MSTSGTGPDMPKDSHKSQTSANSDDQEPILETPTSDLETDGLPYSPPERPRLFGRPVQTDPIFWLPIVTIVIVIAQRLISGDQQPIRFGEPLYFRAFVFLLVMVAIWLALGLLPATIRLIVLTIIQRRRLSALPNDKSRGWKDDPTRKQRQRWWDGWRWSGYVKPLPKPSWRIALLSPWLILIAVLASTYATTANETPSFATPGLSASNEKLIGGITAVLPASVTLPQDSISPNVFYATRGWKLKQAISDFNDGWEPLADHERVTNPWLKQQLLDAGNQATAYLSWLVQQQYSLRACVENKTDEQIRADPCWTQYQEGVVQIIGEQRQVGEDAINALQALEAKQGLPWQRP